MPTGLCTIKKYNCGHQGQSDMEAKLVFCIFSVRVCTHYCKTEIKR